MTGAELAVVHSNKSVNTSAHRMDLALSSQLTTSVTTASNSPAEHFQSFTVNCKFFTRVKCIFILETLD